MVLELTYQTATDEGIGRTIDISSSGLCFEAEKPQRCGQPIEVSIAWPILLYDGVPLQLHVRGKVVRVEGSQTAACILWYEFRTRRVRQAGSGLYIRPLWEASRGQFAYARKITYSFFDKGGYVAQAKRYREYAKATGLSRQCAGPGCT